MRTRLRLLALALIWVIIPGYAQENIIPWSTTQLTWDDFMGSPNSEFYATTAHEIKYSWKTDGNGNLNSTVECYFNKQNSWKKEDKLSPDLLKHEQIHFDIAEIYARHMRRTFAGYSAASKTIEQIKADLGATFNQILTDMKAQEDRYDTETNHSIISEKQQEWNQETAKQLLDLSQYSKQ